MRVIMDDATRVMILKVEKEPSKSEIIIKGITPA